MKIAIGSDHAGFQMKEEFIKVLSDLKYQYTDFGPTSTNAVDYPDFAEKVATAVSKGDAERGILICGTGIGMAIVANKYPKIRAAVCNDLYSAKMSRLHNDANVLTIGGRVVGIDLAKEILKVWLSTDFEAGRHQKRLEKITICEKRVLSNEI